MQPPVPGIFAVIFTGEILCHPLRSSKSFGRHDAVHPALDTRVKRIQCLIAAVEVYLMRGRVG